MMIIVSTINSVTLKLDCSRNVIQLKMKIIDVSNEVWMWDNQKYGTSQIV